SVPRTLQKRVTNPLTSVPQILTALLDRSSDSINDSTEETRPLLYEFILVFGDSVSDSLQELDYEVHTRVNNITDLLSDSIQEVDDNVVPLLSDLSDVIGDTLKYTTKNLKTRVHKEWNQNNQSLDKSHDQLGSHLNDSRTYLTDRVQHRHEQLHKRDNELRSTLSNDHSHRDKRRTDSRTNLREFTHEGADTYAQERKSASADSDQRRDPDGQHSN